jgi:hypothetical protein
MRQEHDGFERSDADASASYKAGFAMLAAMVLTALAVVPMFRLLAKRESQAQPPPAGAVKTEMSEPVQSFPKLVTSEPLALAEFRANEEALLTSYGWVEKDKGLARIPIEHAMRIVAAQGLPKFEAEAGAATPAGAGAKK